MFKKCPFCGKYDVVSNPYSGNEFQSPLCFCRNCFYVWYREKQGNNVDPTELGYGLACQVED